MDYCRIHHHIFWNFLYLSTFLFIQASVNNMKKLIILCWMIILSVAGKAQDKWQQFGDYWYTGEAELTSYELKQSRYGEIHEGHAVLIFVN